MKRLPIVYANDKSGRDYWRSLGEKDRAPAFHDQLVREFPAGASEAPVHELGGEEGQSRRGFLSIMGAAMALAGLASCRRPEEKILPYARPPEEVIPGKPLHFASTLALHGTAFGVLVESHEGRPTKIEGNPDHPESLGATNAFLQASVLDLYDPDRSDGPRAKGEKRTWDDAATALREIGDRLVASAGKSLAIVTEAHRSPTLQSALNDLKKKLPEARIVRWESFDRSASRAGARLAFGRPLDAVADFATAKVIVSLEADFLGAEGNPIKAAKGWARGRSLAEPKKRNRLYVAESAHSVTGASGDHRVRLTSAEVSRFAVAIARAIESQGVSLGIALEDPGALPEKAEKAAIAIATDLLAHQGTGLVVAGRTQPPAIHALSFLIDRALGNLDQTRRFVPAFDESASEGPTAIAELGRAIEAKTIDTVLVLGGNPVFDAPADARLSTLLPQITTIHVGTHLDDTGAIASWHFPRAHALESWTDAKSEDGTLSIGQPLIAPLWNGKTDAEIVRQLIGDPAKAYDLVRATTKDTLGAIDFEKNWRRLLHDGVSKDSAFPSVPVTVQTEELATALHTLLATKAPSLEVVFLPDAHAWDGRFANNGWMQEMPDPLTKQTWGNSAWISAATAKDLGLADGDLASITVEGTSVQVPVLVAPGQADRSIALMVGQGRAIVGRVGKSIGVDVGPLRRSTSFSVAAGSMNKIAGKGRLARTQEHFVMEGRPLAREGTQDEYEKNPEFVKEMVEHPPLENLWKPVEYDGHKWGLTIDLDACTGCNACMIACQSENNIPIVGIEGVEDSREMHWIRVDRYFEGSVDDPTAVSQPVGCQQCENAPCEEVCPVGATTHSPEGLNDMAYNRCIGTRYCANNCPFKVRRFNFHDYTKPLTEPRKMQLNPDVTVRSRGVMEKCTFCVQRINGAKIAAKQGGSDRVKDGAITTACQQACPSEAIVFGDLNDQSARVRAKASEARSYHLLEELNVQPRVTYLAKIKNPNPELES